MQRTGVAWLIRKAIFLALFRGWRYSQQPYRRRLVLATSMIPLNRSPTFAVSCPPERRNALYQFDVKNLPVGCFPPQKRKEPLSFRLKFDDTVLSAVRDLGMFEKSSTMDDTTCHIRPISWLSQNTLNLSLNRSFVCFKPHLMGFEYILSFTTPISRIFHHKHLYDVVVDKSYFRLPLSSRSVQVGCVFCFQNNRRL